MGLLYGSSLLIIKMNLPTPIPIPPVPGLIFIISGPSGVGKTTLCQKLLDTYANQLKRVVTTTSRPPRLGEVDGQDYHFIDDKAFEAGIARNEFYEYAQVHHQWKGIAKHELQGKLSSGLDVLLNIDVQGAQTYRRKAQEDPLLKDRFFTLFILPPSLEALRERLKSRGDLSEEELNSRIEEAENEIIHVRHFDFKIRSSTPEEDFRQVESIYCVLKIRQRKAWIKLHTDQQTLGW